MGDPLHLIQPQSSAVISPCKRYRYRLDRRWGDGLFGGARGKCCWIMLNPSTADATADDPTLRRVVKYSTGWGFSSVVVVNLFAWRSKSPKDLLVEDRDLLGPDYLDHVNDALSESTMALCGWGSSVPRWHNSRPAALMEIIERAGLIPMALAVTKAGAPKHPLYQNGRLPPRSLEELRG